MRIKSIYIYSTVYYVHACTYIWHTPVLVYTYTSHYTPYTYTLTFLHHPVIHHHPPFVEPDLTQEEPLSCKAEGYSMYI